VAAGTAMTMKPSAAFALGLWTGAVVVAAIGAFHLRGLARVAGEPSPQAVKELQAKTEEIQQLRQEQARLTAEDARLRQTISELKRNSDTRALVDTRRDQREVRRRVPFRLTAETPSPPAPGSSTDESWIADAVANADVDALPRLQSAALEGSRAALEALAWLADRDNADALTRVWTSDSLSGPLRVEAARLLAVTLEVNPHGGQLLQTLFTSQDADQKQLAAAIDGLVNPPPRVRPDYAERLQLVDTLRAQVTDPNLLANLDRAREQLAAQTEAPAR
jgi:hypothetical protein